MPKVVEYHRPTSVEEAVGLLAEPSAAVLAGGTRLNATPDGAPVVAIDIQALGLSGIDLGADGRLRIGATATLQQFADSDSVPEGLRDLARREVPSTLRTLATIGGTVAARESNSHLLAGLLVHDAVVGLKSADGSAERPLATVLTDAAVLVGALITHLTIATDGVFAHERTGRTPGDDPIVAAAARRSPDGVIYLALAGVAATPVLLEDHTSLDPPSDFLGSTEYRRHLAEVLTDRVRKAVSA